jgi:hypothetical protein
LGAYVSPPAKILGRKNRGGGKEKEKKQKGKAIHTELKNEK